MNNKTKQIIARFKDQGVPFLETMPRGWRVLQGATTAPHGWRWIHNGGNPFKGESKVALLRII